jgi:hypothetical protein
MIKLVWSEVMVKMGKPEGTEYNDLNESEKAHLDGYAEEIERQALEVKGQCVCGVMACPDEYVHYTSGW